MRIAVSGTHCSGKSTLIEAFLLAHPDFGHEPEPYAVLVEDYGEAFAAEPCADDFFRQLEFNIERLSKYQPDARVIFERSPADFLAYMLALEDLRRAGSDKRLLEKAAALVKDALRDLDMIVFLPLNDADDIEEPDSEDLELRIGVDSRLAAFFSEDEFNPGTSGPMVLEATGSTAKRLRLLENRLSTSK